MELKEVIERQKQINKMFEEEGLTDKILKEQIELNKITNKENLNDGEYVQ